MVVTIPSIDLHVSSPSELLSFVCSLIYQMFLDCIDYPQLNSILHSFFSLLELFPFASSEFSSSEFPIPLELNGSTELQFKNPLYLSFQLFEICFPQNLGIMYQTMSSFPLLYHELQEGSFPFCQLSFKKRYRTGGGKGALESVDLYSNPHSDQCVVMLGKLLYLLGSQFSQLQSERELDCHVL